MLPIFRKAQSCLRVWVSPSCCSFLFLQKKYECVAACAGAQERGILTVLIARCDIKRHLGNLWYR